MKRPWTGIAAALLLGELLGFAILPWKIVPVCLVCIIPLTGIKYAGHFISVRQRRALIIIIICFAAGLLRIYMLRLYEERILAKVYGEERHWRQTEALTSEDQMHISETVRRIDISGDGSGAVIEAGEYLIYADAEFAKELRLGNRICCSGRPKLIEPAQNPGETDMSLYYRSKGIYFKLYADKIYREGSFYFPLSESARKLRQKLLGAMEDYAGEDGAIAAAVLLGERDGIEDRIYELYRRSGIAHILAISGLHMSLIGIGFYDFLRKRLELGFASCAALSSALVYFYSVLTGMGVSVARACAMLVIFFLAQYLGRSYDLISAACLSAVIALVSNPYIMSQSGFILSYAAVIIIAIPLKILIKEFKIKNPFISSVAGSICIQIFMLPLTAYLFFRIPVYAFALNLIVIPLLGILIISGLIFTLLAAAGLPHMPVKFCLAPLHYIRMLYEKLCIISYALPKSSILTGRPELWQMTAYYILVSAALGILVYGRRRCRRERGGTSFEGKCNADGRKRDFEYGKSFGDRAFGLLPYTISLLMIFAAFFTILPVRRDMMCFLNVGQGDGIFIRSGEADILIDCGSSDKKMLGRYTLKPFLESMAVESLDAVFLTHADSDHTSAFIELMKEGGLNTDILYLPYPAAESAEYDYIREAYGGRTDYLHAGQRVRLDNASLSCISPERLYLPEDINEHSLVFVYETYDFKAVLTGDAGIESEKRILESESFSKLIEGADILKAGHHGSRTSSSEEFVSLISPDYVILSYGRNNSYGHPHKESLRSFQKAGAKCISTADSGAISVYTDKKGFHIRRFSDILFME